VSLESRAWLRQVPVRSTRDAAGIEERSKHVAWLWVRTSSLSWNRYRASSTGEPAGVDW